MLEIREGAGAALATDGLIYVLGGGGPNFTQPHLVAATDAASAMG
jgi:hypothetical protein